jgi:hypothetical protein
MTTPPDRCSHGIPWTSPCRECEIVSARETIAHWGPAIDAAREVIKTTAKKTEKDEQ